MGASGIIYVLHGLGTILEDLKIISYSPYHISHIIYLTGPHGNFEKLRLGMQNNNRGIISSSLCWIMKVSMGRLRLRYKCYCGILFQCYHRDWFSCPNNLWFVFLYSSEEEENKHSLRQIKLMMHLQPWLCLSFHPDFISTLTWT